MGTKYIVRVADGGLYETEITASRRARAVIVEQGIEPYDGTDSAFDFEEDFESVVLDEAAIKRIIELWESIK